VDLGSDRVGEVPEGGEDATLAESESDSESNSENKSGSNALGEGFYVVGFALILILAGI